eukprot:Nk52_evm3s123 gene=Nk52_evmTU3s123
MNQAATMVGTKGEASGAALDIGFSVERVLISDNVDPVCEEVLKNAGIDCVRKLKMPKEELIKTLQDFDALIVRSETKVTAEVLEACPRLKVVGRAGTGVDNIDCKMATKMGVMVMNTPGGNTISAAEHTCALLTSLSRNIPQACMALKLGRWDRKLYTGNEVKGKTIAILGLGRIGREVASRMQACGMKTIGYDPILPKSAALEFGVESMDLESIWPIADFITVHTPLTDETRGLIGPKTLSKCKTGVKIVNCARGGIIDEVALLEALNSGKCGGAALDVFSTEPPTDAANNPLIQHPNLVCTPHLGASTEEAQLKVAEEIALSVVAARDGKPIPGAINAKALSHSLRPELAIYVELAQKMGMMIGQFIGGGAFSEPHHTQFNRLHVSIKGKEIYDASQTLTSAVLVGILNHLQSTPVNLINAEAIGEEMGLHVSFQKTKERHEAFLNVINITVEGTASKHSYTGTVYASQFCRVVEIDNFNLEINPTGNMILYRNKDMPGVLATMAATLAKHGINIGELTMGRKPKSSEAFTAISTDSEVHSSVLEELKSVPGVHFLRTVSL